MSSATVQPSSQNGSVDSSAARLPPEDRSSRRWIKKRLAQLDPVEDYAEVCKLTSVFFMSPFMMKWSFTQTMPRFNLGPSGAAIARAGRGKLFTDVDRRYDDTAFHGIAWNEYGPESPQAKRSLDMVNGLHARWQKVYPAEFEDPDLWTYVITFQVCGFASVLGDRLRFPPPDEKVKIARVIFGKKLAEQFIYVDGRRLTEVMPSLDTYDDWVRFYKEYESREFPYCQETTDCFNQVLDSFAKKVALPDFFARALVTAFWHDGMFRYTGIKPSNRALRFAARNFMRFMFIAGALRSDPKESYPEKLRREAAESAKPMNPVLRATQGGAAPSTDSCPFGSVGGEQVSSA